MPGVHGAILLENPIQIAARFDLELFEASFRGWRSTVGDISTEEANLWYPESIEYVLNQRSFLC